MRGDWLFVKYANEIKVGVLVFVALVLTALFLWLLGDYTPMASTYNLYVEYNFAGGVELGTPVRVSGIKVGKVTQIIFLDPSKVGERASETALRLKLNISKKVQNNIRADSKFYINQAGIIGERYIEITPGSANAPVLRPEAVVRGIDPPRFDQLISQSMGLFGELTDIVEQNRAGIEKGVNALGRAGETLDALLGRLSPQDVETARRVINRLDRITSDLEVLMSDLSEELTPTLRAVRRTLDTAQPLLKKSDRLVSQLDGLLDDYEELPRKRREEIRRTFSDLITTAEHLNKVLARLDAFTAMVERDYSDLDRQKIEKILREFLQEEGIRVNVGEVKLKTKK